jgi:hypothetical protein
VARCSSWGTGFLKGLEVHTHLPATVDTNMGTIDSKKSQVDNITLLHTVDRTPPYSQLVVEKIQKVGLDTVVDSSSNTVDTISTDDRTFSLLPKPKQVCVWTAEWMLKRLKEEKNEDLLMAQLKTFIHPKRSIEASIETVSKLVKLPDEEAIGILAEFQKPPRYIRGTKGNQLDLSLSVTTLDTHQTFAVKALLDSGCTGSAIDAGFVKEHGINTKKMHVPIPVYNTDGSHNSGGPIREYVELIIRIKDHVERLLLAVTNLGKSKIFIGYEWLKLHNPSIDWKNGTIQLDRCPSVCNYSPLLADIEDDSDTTYDDDPDAHLEEGDRVFCMDWDSYKLHSLHIRAAGTTSTNLAVKEAEKKPKQTFTEIVPVLYHEYSDIFEKEEFDSLPDRRPWDHAIELTPGARPVSCKAYPLNPAEQQSLDEFLVENLRSGRIRPSKSPWASPFFFVKKKDGSLRPVQDYRQLNDLTIKNKYPLPLIQELVDKLSKAKYFTKLDVRWGYNNIRIKEGDEHKAAFLTNKGLFEPLVMFFGLTNSPATFQTMMNDIFRDLINRGRVVIYLDDILIFSSDLNEHRQTVKEVLEVLRKHKLYLKPEKCEFEKTKIEYLGMIISEGFVQMDPVKVKGVADWPIPKLKRHVQEFLGFTNFYRRFIKDYGKIAKPLTILTGNVKWKWDVEQQLAFDNLKEAVCSAPVLAIPNNQDPFKVETDASDFAVGGTLSQQQDGVWHPVAFLSKAMTETERNYEIYDKELLAVMTALDHWRHYLMGAAHDFEIWSDHQNLQYFRKPQKLNRRQARWTTELAEYHYTLHHKPGKQMIKVDILSRRADHNQGKEDNQDIILLKPEHFRQQVFEFQGPDMDVLSKIRQRKNNKDKAVIKALANKEAEWVEHDDGLVTWKERIYVPKDKSLREKIIRMHHDLPASGHPGRYKTQELITRNYWWPRIQSDVRKYVDGCQVCQKTKPHRRKPAAPLHPNTIPSRKWGTVTVDMIGPLPEAQGFNAILVMVDFKTKQIIAVPTTTDLNSLGWAKLYRDHVYAHHGLSDKIISDRGPQFVSKFITDLYKLLGIEANPSTAYHPQTDGQTERVNQEIEQYLRVFINHRQTDWPEWLPLATFSYNDKVHSSTGFTPFYLNKGEHPRKGTEPRMEQVCNPSAEEFATQMKEISDEASSSLAIAQEQMKRYYDRTRGIAKNYQVGDKVWLEGYNITTDRPSKKLEDKRYGPFQILKRIGKSAYLLKLPPTWKALHPVFNEAVLSPYTPPQFPSQKPPPPPPPVDAKNNIYEVEEIINSKKIRGKLHFLIHWKGYPTSERTWEPARHCKKAKSEIEAFYKKYPDAPK